MLHITILFCQDKQEVSDDRCTHHCPTTEIIFATSHYRSFDQLAAKVIGHFPKPIGHVLSDTEVVRDTQTHYEKSIGTRCQQIRNAGGKPG